MSDDLFLKSWYFGAAIVSVLVGCIVYLALRGTLVQVAGLLMPRGFMSVLARRATAVLLVHAGICGFLWVSMPGCGGTYQQIVSNRRYVVQEASRGAAHALYFVAAALLGTGLAATIILTCRPNRDATPGSTNLAGTVRIPRRRPMRDDE